MISTLTPRSAVTSSALMMPESGRKYGVTIRTDFWAQARAPSRTKRAFSKSSSGPSFTARAATPPTLERAGNHCSPSRDSWVV